MTTPDAMLQTPQNCLLYRNGTASVVLVCEHASAFIPDEYHGLGLSPEARTSHVAWDPGALGVAKHLSGLLDAKLVVSNVSRLVYDCNRPPDAAGAMPARSEIYDIPGNQNLTPQDRARRIETCYEPFRSCLHTTLKSTSNPVLITVHSFTPIYFGKARDVEIGLLHDSDARLAEQMMRDAAGHVPHNVRINQPYGPEDGVTHTLREHAIPSGLLNVMLEIRNDLIATPSRQLEMAEMLGAWISAALASTAATEAHS